MDIKLIKRPPTVKEYQQLREAVGWNKISVKAAGTALKNSLFSICAVSGGKVAACGRVIGDGAVYFYIQDIIVLPEFQGKGLGRIIMDEIMKHLARSAPEKAFIGLMAAKNVSGFYVKYGFKKRPEDSPGMFRRTEEQDR